MQLSPRLINFNSIGAKENITAMNRRRLSVLNRKAVAFSNIKRLKDYGQLFLYIHAAVSDILLWLRVRYYNANERIQLISIQAHYRNKTIRMKYAIFYLARLR